MLPVHIKHNIYDQIVCKNNNFQYQHNPEEAKNPLKLFYPGLHIRVKLKIPQL